MSSPTVGWVLNMIQLAPLVQALSVIAACWAIIAGINAWKREYIGKRQIDLAEQTLAKFFEVKDAIRFIRNPLVRIDEVKVRAKSPDEPDESFMLSRSYLALERYATKEAVFIDFRILQYKFLASFGYQHQGIFEQMSWIIDAIPHAGQSIWFTERLSQDAVGEARDVMTKSRDMMLAILLESDEKDEIVLKLADAQKKLEAATRPCFEEAMASYNLLTKKWWS
jgi:hypothetical protein